MIITKDQAERQLNTICVQLCNNTEDCFEHYAGLSSDILDTIYEQYEKQSNQLVLGIRAIYDKCFIAENEFNYSVFILAIDTYLYVMGYSGFEICSDEEIMFHDLEELRRTMPHKKWSESNKALLAEISARIN